MDETHVDRRWEAAKAPSCWPFGAPFNIAVMSSRWRQIPCHDSLRGGRRDLETRQKSTATTSIAFTHELPQEHAS